MFLLQITTSCENYPSKPVKNSKFILKQLFNSTKFNDTEYINKIIM